MRRGKQQRLSMALNILTSYEENRKTRRPPQSRRRSPRNAGIGKNADVSDPVHAGANKISQITQQRIRICAGGGGGKTRKAMKKETRCLKSGDAVKTLAGVKYFSHFSDLRILNNSEGLTWDAITLNFVCGYKETADYRGVIEVPT